MRHAMQGPSRLTMLQVACLGALVGLIIGAAIAVADNISCAGGGATCEGTSGHDTITGSSNADDIYAHAGNDDVEARGGADYALGQVDDDDLDGELGNDNVTFSGTLHGIEGGENGDIVRGGAADDVVRGGDGHDTVRGDDGADVVVTWKDGVSDTLGGGQGNNACYFDVLIDTVEGGC